MRACAEDRLGKGGRGSSVGAADLPQPRRHRRARTGYQAAEGRARAFSAHTQLTLRHDTPPAPPTHPGRRSRARLRLQSINAILLLLAHGVHRGGVVPFFLRPDLALEPLRRRRLLAVPRSVGLEDGVPLDGVAVAVVPRVPRVAVDARAAAGVGVRRRR